MVRDVLFRVGVYVYVYESACVCVCYTVIYMDQYMRCTPGTVQKQTRLLMTSNFTFLSSIVSLSSHGIQVCLMTL
jgi:hypothetical protein